MARATWNEQVIAESDRTVVIEGNHYFSPESVRMELLRPSATRTVCPWKGEAIYYDVVVGGRVNKDAAWSYPSPKPEAGEIARRIAFWRGVAVES